MDGGDDFSKKIQKLFLGFPRLASNGQENS